MKKNIIITIAIILSLLVVVRAFYFFDSPWKNFRKNPQTFCKFDSDCSCGRHIITGECLLGNKRFVNIKEQCPDFCGGISGNLIIKCINNECKQIVNN
jgi:hypothetical protein